MLLGWRPLLLERGIEEWVKPLVFIYIWYTLATSNFLLLVARCFATSDKCSTTSSK